jgi:L-threonylcarbamoyladenylate synthase
VDVNDTADLADPATLDRVTAALLAGRAVVLPTDTVYGVAALPAHEDELRRLKGRPDSVPIAVLVADVGQAELALGAPLPATAVRLAATFWPGPLTLVAPTASGATLGVRCPDHAFVRAVAAAVGPLATTSANRHGEPTPAEAQAAAASLVGPVAVVVDGGTLAGTASTVVDATGPAPVILREGDISSEAVAAAVR